MTVSDQAVLNEQYHYDWDSELEQLVKKVRQYEPNSIKLVSEAFEFARYAHQHQTRRSGAPYFSHPLAVANFLVDQNFDSSTVIAALLHDTIEDTNTSYETIRSLFGREIANVVQGLTKLNEMNQEPIDQALFENLLKFIHSGIDDDRVIIVKLADRIHNLKTIEHLSQEKQRLKSKETLDFLAPLAELFGLNAWREELEDLAFKTLYPRARQSVIRQLEHLRSQTETTADGKSYIELNKVNKQVENLMRHKGINHFTIKYREKRPYSIWQKMLSGTKRFSSITDIFGIRVITQIEDDVYATLGLIHTKWQARPNRFKDYISHPKPNGYRSLHTTVMVEGNEVEFQIRTKMMHEAAESGVASHWLYKEGIKGNNPYVTNTSQIIKRAEKVMSESHQKENFINRLREEFKTLSVFCYTPSNDLVWLPENSTILDFAYELNQDLGNRAISATVDGRIAPLSSPVSNGQVINIITSAEPFFDDNKKKSANTHKGISYLVILEDSLQFKRTKEEGKKFLQITFERHNKKLNNKAIRTAAELLNYKSSDDLLRQIGSRVVKPEDIFALLYPDSPIPAPNLELNSIESITGLPKGARLQIAPCCYPVPGDRIIGFQSDRKTVVVHMSDCDELGHLVDEDNWVDLRWSLASQPCIHNTLFKVELFNRPGALGELCEAILLRNAKINGMTCQLETPDSLHYIINILVNNASHLYGVMHNASILEPVISIERHRKTSEYRKDTSELLTPRR